MFGYLWISKREWARHQRELSTALKRASDAENDLRAERQAKDWLTLQLSSRLVTKSGQYGLDHIVPPRTTETTTTITPHPKRFTHEPTEIDFAKLEYYKECYRREGKSEDEAELLWEAEMRGESPVYPYEEMEAEH